MLAMFKKLFAALLSLGLLVGSAGAASAATHRALSVRHSVHLKPSSDSWSHVKPSSDSWSHVKPSSDSWSHVKPSSDSWSHVKPSSDSWSSLRR